MQTNTYLFFKGNCAEAFKFYEKTLGATQLMMMKNGDLPEADQMPGGPETIAHARLKIGETLLMASDSPADRYHEPQGFAVSLLVETNEKAESIFAVLSEGGHVIMPIVETFWAERFGMVVDQFGIMWMVNHEKPM